MEFIIKRLSGSLGLSSEEENRLEDPSLWPSTLKDNYDILSNEEKKLVVLLLSLNQHHLFEKWDKLGVNDNQKHLFFNQVKLLHESYTVSGGLASYIDRSKKLLQSARLGENPLDGWRPEVPVGATIDPFSQEFIANEYVGLSEVARCGFVLVAGGLGERLGYNGIKVELPTEMTTTICYLELYCQQILSMQKYLETEREKELRGSDKNKMRRLAPFLPLAIMVSEDTEMKTIQLLENNNYFGLKKSQVTIMKQGKVAALLNNSAHISQESPYVIDAKPHGHGDVHALMHSTHTAKKWLEIGIKWVVFFQDTNGLAFHSLPAMLGVSVKLGLDVNSLTIPRVAKQAVGAIVKLINDSEKREMTVNVEYNQLDPLLRSTVSPDGDVNDPTTGMSIYPGNINQLLFRLEPYLETLIRTEGVMGEFVNPKYSDSTKTTFKKPTRLECMMQDYPKVLPLSSKVGFTSMPSWICFSPCKNNSVDAAGLLSSGVPPGSAFSAESDQYHCHAEMLRLIGVNIQNAQPVTYLGISSIPGPRIVLHPSFAVFPNEIKQRFPFPSKVTITSRSTLIIIGDVEIINLHLDGALTLEAVPGTKLIVNTGTRKIYNRGHELVGLSGNNTTEFEKMRGYSIKRHDTNIISTGTIDMAVGSYIYTGKSILPFNLYDPESETKSNNCNCLFC